MELVVLAVPDCPNAPLLEERLAEALEGRADVSLVRRLIRDEEDAAAHGMHGSPTLLVDGADPFAEPGTPPSLSCRFFRDGGGMDRAPSVTTLRRVLAGEDLLGRAGRGRLAPTAGGLRAVQRRVLAAFAQNGAAPGPAELTAASGVLRTLHEEDFLRLDDAGRIRAAYPFSAVPTAHEVRIAGGPLVHAMCAIDALGIAAMVGADTTITSADPVTGEKITVTVEAGGARATWRPATTVVFEGTEACCEAAADGCCGNVNFFATPASAATWAAARPHVTGQVVGQSEALHSGTQIFGSLLHP